MRPPIYAELVETHGLDPAELPDHDLAALLALHPAPLRDGAADHTSPPPSSP